MINKLINNLPERFQWTPHNLVAHPLMEILHQLGFHELSNKVHQITIPQKDGHENNKN
jgi:hypothetical protein